MPFQIRELVPGCVFGEILFWSAVCALLLCLIVWATLRRRNHQITEGPTWTFKDSWASNLTALGAILGTVLAASGFLTDALPGLSTGMFVGFSLLLGLLVLLAPIVFTIFSSGGKPTYHGLLIAGGITLWAVIGELAIAVQLANRAGVPEAIGWLGLGVAIIGLLFYTRASIIPAIEAASPPAVDLAVAATGAAAAAAAAAVAGGKEPAEVEADARKAAKAAILAAKTQTVPGAARELADALAPNEGPPMAEFIPRRQSGVML